MLRYDGDNFEEDVVPSEDKDNDIVPTSLDQDECIPESDCLWEMRTA